MEQAVGHRLIVDALEKAVEAYGVFVELVVSTVVNRRNPSDDIRTSTATAFGKEVLGLCMLKEGVLPA